MIQLMNMRRHGNVPLRVAKGHFATNHSHINYYIDVTTQKCRLSEASAVAEELVSYYNNSTVIDSILCLDGTQVIGTCLAEKLTEANFVSVNAHQTIYVLTPEHTTGSQIIFRDSLLSAVAGKHVLILAASVTTGYTAKRSIEAIGYYGGKVAGVAAIYRAVDEVAGYPVRSIYSVEDLPDYKSYDYRECPYCKSGQKLDALVNSFGYSAL